LDERKRFSIGDFLTNSFSTFYEKELGQVARIVLIYYFKMPELLFEFSSGNLSKGHFI
jgi:hypothetical protein